MLSPMTRRKQMGSVDVNGCPHYTQATSKEKRCNLRVLCGLGLSHFVYSCEQNQHFVCFCEADTTRTKWKFHARANLKTLWQFRNQKK